MKNFIFWCVVISILSLSEGCAPSSSNNWVFKEQPTASVVTQKNIIEGLLPILYVFRDSVDGQWIFLADEKSGEDEVKVVTLEEIVKIDGSIKQLSGLPAGWKAWREEKNKPWNRSKLMHEYK